MFGSKLTKSQYTIVRADTNIKNTEQAVDRSVNADLMSLFMLIETPVHYVTHVGKPQASVLDLATKLYGIKHQI